MLSPVLRNVSAEFNNNILMKLRGDPVGELCRTDPTIIKIGSWLYDKVRSNRDKADEVRKNVRMDMRRLAHLYKHFEVVQEMQDAEEPTGQPSTSQSTADSALSTSTADTRLQSTSAVGVASMLNHENFEILKEAITQYTTRPDVEDVQEGLKAGMKSALYTLLRKAAKILKANYVITNQLSDSTRIDLFLHVLTMCKNMVFGDATYKLNKQRQMKLRRPAQLPPEDDCARLRTYTLSRISELTKDASRQLTPSEFVALRDLVVCRLTMFNARRGGEPARLTVKEWLAAKNDEWLVASDVDKLPAFEKQLFSDFKLTYQSGKGNNHIVPILFPADTISAMQMLTHDGVRDAAAVSLSNAFAFPSTNGSAEHCSGWHSINRVATAAGVQKLELLNATKIRHLVSTLYAALDVPEKDRHLFYSHMGHSANINHSIYQAPLTVQEITKVGVHLQQIDHGK